MVNDLYIFSVSIILVYIHLLVGPTRSVCCWAYACRAQATCLKRKHFSCVLKQLGMSVVELMQMFSMSFSNTKKLALELGEIKTSKEALTYHSLNIPGSVSYYPCLNYEWTENMQVALEEMKASILHLYITNSHQA